MAISHLPDLLGVQPHEVKRVTALIVSSFFLGAALVLDYTASNAIFLTVFDISWLPYMYIVNAGLTMAFGAFYAILQERVPFERLLYLTNAILAAIMLIFWLILQTTGSSAVIFLNMALYRLIFIFTTVGLWELASEALDIQQAKRLFPLVSLGLLAAFILGGLFTPLIARLLGVVNMLLFAAGFLIAYTWMLTSQVPQMGIPHKRRQQPGQALSMQELFNDGYIRYILGLKICSMLVAYVIEYIFYQQAAVHFSNQAALANFLGIFIGSATLLMVLIAGLVSGRYIVRYGIKIALPTMPAAIVITALISAVYGLWMGTGGIFFGLIAIIMYANQVFERSVYTPTLAVLYQPIALIRRMQVRVAVEGWFGSVALVASGVLLLAFGWLPVDNIVPYVFLLLLIALVFVFLARRAYYGYARQLEQVIRACSVTRSFGGRQPQESPLSPQGFAAFTTEARLETIRSLEQSRSDGVVQYPSLGLACEVPLSIELRHIWLHALWRCAYRTAAPEVELYLLQQEVRTARWALASLQAAPCDALQRALHSEMYALRQRVGWLLAFVDERLVGLPLALFIPDLDQRATVLAAIEEILPAEIKPLACALLAEPPNLKRLAALQAPEEAIPSQAELFQVAAAKAAIFTVWTRACMQMTMCQSPEWLVEDRMLTLIEKVTLLRSVGIFTNTPEFVLAELAGKLRHQVLARNETLIHQGELCAALYLLVSGQVRIHNGDTTLAQLGPGETIGELAVLDPAPNNASVTALSECQLFVLDGDQLCNFMQVWPDVLPGIVRVLAGRLRTQCAQA